MSVVLRTLPVLAPVALALLVGWTGDGAAAARFQGLVAGLVATSALGAFGGRTSGGALARLVAAAVLVGTTPLLLGGTTAQALAAAWLALAAGAAALGIAALLRRLGAPDVPAGAVALAILVLAMGALFWADPVADRLPSARRHAFRQTVLHVDLALAAAYDGAGYDRLRADDVYFDVPLASGLLRVPRALPTGGLWLTVGVVLGGLSVLRRRRKEAT